MANFTDKCTVDGWVSLSDLMRNNFVSGVAYSGTNPLGKVSIRNEAAEQVFIHLSNNAMFPPPSDTDAGDVIGAGEDAKTWVFEQTSPDDFLDAGTTWLWSANPVEVHVNAVGGGI